MTAFLLKRYWPYLAIVLLAGALFVACAERDQALREEGAMRERLADLTAKTKRDSVAGVLASSAVARDTIVLTKWLTKYDTVRHTLNIHDTVAVVTYLNTVDSTMHACREAVGSLTTLCERKDTLIADLRAQLAVRVGAPPKSSIAQRVLWGLGGLAVGIVADRAVQH